MLLKTLQIREQFSKAVIFTLNSRKMYETVLPHVFICPFVFYQFLLTAFSFRFFPQSRQERLMNRDDSIYKSCFEREMVCKLDKQRLI